MASYAAPQLDVRRTPRWRLHHVFFFMAIASFVFVNYDFSQRVQRRRTIDSEFIFAYFSAVTLLPMSMCGLLWMAYRLTSAKRTSRRFPSHVLSRGKKASMEEAELVKLMPYHVSFKRIPGNEASKRPHGTLFYPTDVPATTTIPFLPFGDFRYAEGTARYQGLPKCLLNGLADSCIEMTEEAVPAATLELTSDSPQLGGKQHPVIIFSHGMAGHQHQYISFISDLVATGAIVYALEHTDGSAAFARRPPHMPTDTCPVHSGFGVELERLSAKAKKGTGAEAVFRFCQMYQVRVPEILSAITFVQQGGLHRALNCTDAAVQMARVRYPPVGLVGHSFGAATVAAATLAIAERGVALRWLTYTIAFDHWHVPTNGLELIAQALHEREKALNKRLLSPIHFIDSAEWVKREASRQRAHAIAAAWGNWASYQWTSRSDHLTLTEVSEQFPFIPGIRDVASVDDRLQKALWAMIVLDKIRHVNVFKPTAPPAPAGPDSV
jgi:hypothetical protein